MTKETYSKIVVWCSQADKMAAPGEKFKRFRSPCVTSSDDITPCGLAVCVPMQNYLMSKTQPRPYVDMNWL